MYDWMTRAQCRVEGTEPEVFFPVSERGLGAAQVVTAKTVCARCSVSRECLDYAMDAGLAFGVFGGHTPTERASEVDVSHEWALAV